MPAHQWEIDQAVDEGVEVHTSWGPRVLRAHDEEAGEGDRTGSGYTLTSKKIEREASGKVKGVEFMKCISVFDENRRFSPQYDDCEIQHFDADTVIFAIGQAPDTAFIDVADIRIDRGLVKVDNDYMDRYEGYLCGRRGDEGPRFCY